MYLLLVIIVWILFARKFIDWSQWRKQYPTVLFFAVATLSYNLLYYNHTLWAFRGITAAWLNHTIINFAFTFFICPMTLFIFLQKFPKERKSQFVFFTVWVTFYSAIQALFAHKGMFVYDNGWNSLHNIWLNIVLFTFVIIHYRNPAIAILLAIPAVALFLFIFPVPLDSLK
ncbi:hypothetical protein MUG87_19070 [Ectobacillus sp. JY-23]|uniref:CBO0543 family protein n=1 Tax=Ectobacillus sp. JY-23 TaxID=2933872 RepID=UPI001FF3076C|nr:CBO0543 family protein [Ectobacillus sp. JY-23]UOY92486.1 hypothetical protein MUG87_19070 [Ectobacillus sp. JY-23]